MNRRGFLTSLIGGVIAVGVAPNILAGAGRKWIKAKSGLYIVNPDWVNAPFELTWVFSKDALKGYVIDGRFGPEPHQLFPNTEDQLIVNDPYPRRFLDADMEHEVPVFKYA